MAVRGAQDGTELSKALVALRAATGHRQVDVVERTALSQARLSRIEKGKSLPSAADVDQLLALYGATPEQTVEIRALADAARAGIKDSRLVVQRGNTLALQQRWRRIEDDARTVRSYQPALILGVLQTPAYAAVVLERDKAAVADRALRAHALRRPGRRYVLVQTEGALRMHVGSDEVMAEQWAHLVSVLDEPSVELGIIPARYPVDIVIGSGFHIYDDDTAVIGLEVAAATLTDAADVAHFRARFERLAAMAVFGDDARNILRRIGDDYQGMG